jgi:hypothetical protein
MPGSRVILGTALGLLVALLVLTGARRSQHVLRSNLTPPAGFTTVVPGGARLCQSRELVPDGAGAVKLRIGTYGVPGPALRMSVRSPRRQSAVGGLKAGWREGDVAVPISEVMSDHERAEVCLTNKGRERIALAGTVRDPSIAARLDGHPVMSRVWLEYLESRPRSDWALAPAVVRRAAAVRDALPGSFTLPLWCLLALGTAGAATALVMRELRS